MKEKDALAGKALGTLFDLDRTAMDVMPSLGSSSEKSNPMW
jgi:hypothetical protein